MTNGHALKCFTQLMDNTFADIITNTSIINNAKNDPISVSMHLMELCNDWNVWQQGLRMRKSLTFIQIEYFFIDLFYTLYQLFFIFSVNWKKPI